MGLLRYLFGIGIGALGLILLVLGIASLIYFPILGSFILIVGVVMILFGRFCARTALRHKPKERIVKRAQARRK